MRVSTQKVGTNWCLNPFKDMAVILPFPICSPFVGFLYDKIQNKVYFLAIMVLREFY